MDIDPNILREVIAQINEIVDFEDSANEHRFIVKRGISEEVRCQR